MAWIGVLFTLGCAPGSDAGGPPFGVDLLPPVLLGAEAPDAHRLVFTFDEPVAATDPEAVTAPNLSIASSEASGHELHVVFSTVQDIGEPYTIRAAVEDGAGNTLEFLHEFTGWNPRLPRILINELNPRGSGRTPDCIELFVVEGGNLGGLRLTVGTASDYSGELRFPAVEVSNGDFILVHAKAEGLGTEVDEVGDTGESGGLLAHETARDFWIPDAPGLPGNNGAVVLYERRGGPVMDAVIWSDRIDDLSDDKLGWTSEGFKYAEALASAGAWTSGAMGIPGPSDAVDVSLSTATRSLCRASMPADSNSKDDWHTVPTRGQSFGTANTDDVHTP